MLIERVDPNPTRWMLVVSSRPMVDPYILQVGLYGSNTVQIWARLAVTYINGALIYIRTLWFNPYKIWHIISNQFFAKDTYILPFISHHPQKIKKQKRDWSKHLEEGSNPLLTAYSQIPTIGSWKQLPSLQVSSGEGVRVVGGFLSLNYTLKTESSRHGMTNWGSPT